MSWDSGLSVAMPTIVVPSVQQFSAAKQLNPDEIILITANEASWLGKYRIYYF